MSMETLARARDYLAGSQLPDGSWGSGDPFICARALYALHAGRFDDALARGLTYLESRQDPAGRFVPVTGMYSDAASTAYALIVMNKFDYGKASLPITRGILWLLENQGADGSWGTNKKKKAYTTTFGLRALHTFYLDGINRFARGLGFAREYLEGLDFNGEPVSHVYAPIVNLERIGCLDAAMEKKFMGYALEASGKAMARGSIADSAYLLGALKALGEEGMAPCLERWLAAAQNGDGGFGKDTASQSAPNWTALAALAMSGRL